MNNTTSNQLLLSSSSSSFPIVPPMSTTTPWDPQIVANRQHIDKVENVKKELDNVNLKRKRTYSENYQIVQAMKERTLILKNTIQTKASASSSSNDDNNNNYSEKELAALKSSMAKNLKQILSDTNRAKKSHRVLHASIAKLGKSIDKNFQPDLFLYKPSKKLTKKEMLQIRKHINHSVTTHIAMIGANTANNDESDIMMNKYNKDSESTKINNNKTSSSSSSSSSSKKQGKEEVISINLIGNKDDNNKDNGKKKASKSSSNNSDSSNFDDEDNNNDNNNSNNNTTNPIHNLYMELNSIVTDLLCGKTEGAITWTMSNVDNDEDILDLEFQLRSLHYINLLSQNDMDGAVRYSQANFPKFVNKYGDAIQSLMGCLLFPGANSSNNKYAQMQSEETWQKTVQTFKRCYCKQHGLPLNSALATAVNVGVGAMDDIRKLDSIMEKKNTGSNFFRDDGNNNNDDNNNNETWHELKELPVNIEIGQDVQFHSIFTCPVSKEQATALNPPVLLTCGHALCKESMLLIARGRSRFKCPYCPREIFGRDVIELSI